MFEAFTTKGMSGSGLGLWISAGIMERHQGRIWVRTSVQASHHGTVMNVFLPFVEAPSAD
jgi:signal transduction histidine kinase